MAATTSVISGVGASGTGAGARPAGRDLGRLPASATVSSGAVGATGARPAGRNLGRKPAISGRGVGVSRAGSRGANAGRAGGVFVGRPAITTTPSGALGRASGTTGSAIIGWRRGGLRGGAPAITNAPCGVTVPSGVARIKPSASRAKSDPKAGGLIGARNVRSGSWSTTCGRAGCGADAAERANLGRLTVSALVVGSSGRRGARCQTPVAA